MPQLTRKQRRHRSNSHRRLKRQYEKYAHIFERFPCFMPAGDIRPPLAHGIRTQLIEAAPDIDEITLSKALRSYTDSARLYRITFRMGEARLNLDGSIGGFVTAAEAEHAGRLLVGVGLFAEAAAIGRSLIASAAA